MSEQQAKDESTVFLNVLFDVRAKMFVGRGGRWMTAAEFVQNPPHKPEDLVPPPPPGGTAETDPDPGPIYKCIGGFLYCCNGLTCTKVLRNGQPVHCP